jgi:hypothetical protein
MNLVRIAAMLFLCGLAGPAFGHHLWLEPEAQGMRLYFGEFGENLREESPGALDRLQPKAKAVSPKGERALGVERSAKAFVVSGGADPTDSIVVEDARYPVFVRDSDGTTTRSIYWPAARFVPDRAPRAAMLDLDVVPASGDRFKVVFKGKPLPKAKVSVIARSGWARELHAGDDGEFSVALPWRDAYVLEVHHADKAPGRRGDEAYDVVNYVTSLTVVQAQGLQPLPPPPPAKPY